MRIATSVVILFAISVAVNYPWELAQSLLYEWAGESREVWWHCFLASLGDGLMVLAVFGSGWLIFERLDWFVEPGLRGYFIMVIAGLVLAAGVELIAVYALNRWSYAPQMPRIPGLEVGLVPIMQMVILPPLIFRFAAAALAAAASRSKSR